MANRFVVSVPATAGVGAEVVYAQNSVRNEPKSQFDRRIMVWARIDDWMTAESQMTQLCHRV
jgi:hypothetical protein